MAVSLRQRPVLRGKDAERFLSEEKKVNECRAQLLKEEVTDEPLEPKAKRAFGLCVKK